MNYLIQINGEVRGPFPIGKLIDEGITKNTRACLDGTEDWYVAENISELDSIWKESKKIIPKNTENKKEPVSSIEYNKEEKIPQTTHDENEVEEKKQKDYLSKMAILNLFKMGVIIIIFFSAVDWFWEHFYSNTKSKQEKATSLIPKKKEEDISLIPNKKEKEVILIPKKDNTDKPSNNKLSNPQNEYDKLIEEGIIEYKKDNFSEAKQIFLLAEIVKRDHNLQISNQAQSAYRTAINNGDILFGDGKLKEVIPVAQVHYEIARAINSTPNVELKIKECKSNL